MGVIKRLSIPRLGWATGVTQGPWTVLLGCWCPCWASVGNVGEGVRRVGEYGCSVIGRLIRSDVVLGVCWCEML